MTLFHVRLSVFPRAASRSCPALLTHRRVSDRLVVEAGAFPNKAPGTAGSSAAGTCAGGSDRPRWASRPMNARTA